MGVHHLPCQHCATEKIRMKKISNELKNPATIKREQIMIDLSWIKTNSYAKNRYWLLIMDEYTNYYGHSS
jgi:hypothetical protein